MTTMRIKGWELAFACLVIGCGSSKSSQTTPETTPTAPTGEHEQMEHSQMGTHEETTPTTPTGSDTTAKGTEADKNAPGGTATGTESPVSAPVAGQTGANKPAAGGAAEQPAGAAPAGGTQHAEAVIKTLDKEGKELGTLTLDQNGNQVTMKATFTGLKPGPHGIHIHEKGDCGGKAAKNAGAHFNPTKAKHGPPESGERHAGDFGNLTADKQGNATFEMTTDSITLGSDANSVMNKAIIIHAKKDNGKTQPSGASGPPIACGVISAK
jgi:superoxide dismutase, Cu-Zn family